MFITQSIRNKGRSWMHLKKCRSWSTLTRSKRAGWSTSILQPFSSRPLFNIRLRCVFVILNIVEINSGSIKVGKSRRWMTRHFQIDIQLLRLKELRDHLFVKLCQYWKEKFYNIIILVKKLELYGFSEKTRQWLLSFPTNRSQQVRI